jgi:excisionase family DNA binding protein
MTDRVELAIRELVAALRAEITPAPEPCALVDIATTAHLLGISRTTVYQLLDSGRLASLTIGRRRLVSRVAIEAFLESSVGVR